MHSFLGFHVILLELIVDFLERLEVLNGDAYFLDFLRREWVTDVKLELLNDLAE